MKILKEPVYDGGPGFSGTMMLYLRRTLVRHSFVRRCTSTAEALCSKSEVHVLCSVTLFSKKESNTFD
jgi:hypothetical protein